MKLSKAYSSAKLLLILVGLGFSSCLIAGEAFMLVSEEEYRLQLGQDHVQRKRRKPSTRSIFGIDENAPHIIVKSPSVKSGLYSPIRIDINFKASDDAAIQLDSLKVLYGWMDLDITDRIMQYAQVSRTGVSAENVELPVGEHNITIEISDTKGRDSEKDIYFEVLSPGSKKSSSRRLIIY